MISLPELRHIIDVWLPASFLHLHGEPGRFADDQGVRLFNRSRRIVGHCGVDREPHIESSHCEFDRRTSQ